MTWFSLTRLMLLSAIWGASFMFTRIAVPAVGPAWLVESRVGLAALFLLGVAFYTGSRLDLGRNWKALLVLGLLNSALPFMLFAYAAQSLSASLLAVFNSTAPIWGAIVGRIWIGNTLGAKQLAGLLLGVAGVSMLVGFDPLMLDPDRFVSLLAALGAPLSYAIASTYVQRSPRIHPLVNAHGSMWAASLLMLPLLLTTDVPVAPGELELFSLLALGVLCTGVAYILYFRLIAEIGAPSALTVTYLIPLFGIGWGMLFLDEQPGWSTLVGAATVLLGTAFVTGFSWRRVVGSG